MWFEWSQTANVPIEGFTDELRRSTLILWKSPQSRIKQGIRMFWWRMRFVVLFAEFGEDIFAHDRQRG